MRRALPIAWFLFAAALVALPGAAGARDRARDHDQDLWPRLHNSRLPHDNVGDPVIPPPEAPSAAELQTRQGWLAFAQIDDARDALRVGQTAQAHALVDRARASLGDASGLDPRLPAELQDAGDALARGDAAAAGRPLDQASAGLRGALVALDFRLHPGIAHSPSGETYAYGGTGGLEPPDVTGDDRRNPPTLRAPPAPSGFRSNAPTFHPIEPYLQ